MKTSSFFFGFALLFFFSCSNPSEKKTDEIPNTPTSGSLKVFCEEGFTLPMKLQEYTFEALYDHVKVDVKYVNEAEAIEGLFNDSCKDILISRNLSGDELKKFQTANIFLKQTCVAKNAIAFVVGRSARDTSFSVDKLKALLSGADTSARIVFDNTNSGVAKFLKDSLLKGAPFGKNCFALKTTEELIKHVSEKNTIGVMDYSWISDQDETTTKEILVKIKTIPVSATDKMPAFYPDQSNIETRDYPFCRYMYMIRRSADFTLGTGFLAFVAGQKGQLMMLKMGLVPAFRQEREIEVNTAPLGQ